MDPIAFPPPYEGGFDIKNTSGDEDDFFQVDEGTCGTVVNLPQPLITHGQATEEGQFPWHAALYYSLDSNLTYMCGASPINMKHLLIVAHCVTRRKSTSLVNRNNLVVSLGKFYRQEWNNSGIQDRRVDSILVHPDFDPQTFRHDIAVLKLSTTAKLTNYVRPICLWEGPTQLDNVVGTVGTVVGWGIDETGKMVEQLTKASMPIVSQETCIYSFRNFFASFTSNMTFCSGFQNGTSACNGDSGGGLVLPKSNSDPNNPVWQIRGLVSISVALQNGTCDASHYVVFTDVAKYLDFINNALSL